MPVFTGSDSLRDRFGPDIPIRIHGFNNDWLERVAQARASNTMFIRNAEQILKAAKV